MSATITTLHSAAKVHDIPLAMNAVQRRVRERLAAEALREAVPEAPFVHVDTPDDPPDANVFHPLSAEERAAMDARKTPQLRTFADDEAPPDDMPSRAFEWMGWAALCCAAGVIGGFAGVHLGFFALGMG